MPINEDVGNNNNSIIEIDQEPRAALCVPALGQSGKTAMAFLNTLLVQDYTPSEAGELCYICHNEYPENDSLVYFLSCGHKFHLKCIRSWLRKPDKNTCPVCKIQLYKTNI
jgi:hypothetical protein